MEWGYGVYAQEKADGMFVNINNSLSGIHILSRQGTEIPIDKFPVEAMQLHNVLPVGYQIHGEMLIQNPSGEVAPREIGNGMINSICKGGNVPQGWKIRFHVWDCIPLRYVASKGRYTEPYRSRFEMLSEMISKSKMRLAESGQVISCVHTIETKICYSLTEAQAFFKKMLSQGKEGAVLKNPTAIWRDGTSKEQIKLKLECDCDLEIAGFDEGEGKFRGNLGSLICKSSDGLLVTNVSGFSDKVRKQIWSSREDYLGRIVTVRFNDVMQKTGQPASLFLPRFVEVRSDKIEADTLNRVLESQQQAIALV
jgi:DNA ligase-1